MIDYVPRASREIAHALVDVFAFGCTSGSLVAGMGYDRRIMAAIREATGKPATTTATACLQAFRSRGIERIALVTPYEEWLTRAETDFFAANGVSVVAAKGLGTRDPEEIAGVDPGRIYRLAREVDRSEAEAIFISCTDFQAAAAIDALEADLGKPVFTSNQVTLWALLRLAGVQVPVPGYGRLLADIGSRQGENLNL